MNAVDGQPENVIPSPTLSSGEDIITRMHPVNKMFSPNGRCGPPCNVEIILVRLDPFLTNLKTSRLID